MYDASLDPIYCEHCGGIVNSVWLNRCRCTRDSRGNVVIYADDGEDWVTRDDDEAGGDGDDE